MTTEEPDGPMPTCFSPETYRAEVARRKAAERERDELALQAERLIGENEQTRTNLADMARQLAGAEQHVVELQANVEAHAARLSRAEAERAALAAELASRLLPFKSSEDMQRWQELRQGAAAQPVARGPEVELTDNAAACNCIAARLMPRQLAGSHHILDEAGVSEGEVGGRLSGARLNERIRFLIDQVRHCETQVTLAGTPAAPPVRDETKPPPGWTWVAPQLDREGRSLPPERCVRTKSLVEMLPARAWALYDAEHGYAPPPQPTPDAALREALRRIRNRLHSATSYIERSAVDGAVHEAVDDLDAALAGTPPGKDAP